MIVTKQDMAKNIIVALYNLKSIEEVEKHDVTRKHYNRILKRKKENLKNHYEMALNIINEKIRKECNKQGD